MSETIKQQRRATLDQYGDVMNIAELTELLGVGRNNAYGLIKHGDIRHIRVGRRVIIPKSAVIDFLESAS